MNVDPLFGPRAVRVCVGLIPDWDQRRQAAPSLIHREPPVRAMRPSPQVRWWNGGRATLMPEREAW
jgi:hypothetical protein